MEAKQAFDDLFHTRARHHGWPSRASLSGEGLKRRRMDDALSFPAWEEYTSSSSSKQHDSSSYLCLFLSFLLVGPSSKGRLDSHLSEIPRSLRVDNVKKTYVCSRSLSRPSDAIRSVHVIKARARLPCSWLMRVYCAAPHLTT